MNGWRKNEIIAVEMMNLAEEEMIVGELKKEEDEGRKNGREWAKKVQKSSHVWE